ncbi:MAG: helix-turn-helix transcriptional regulator [Clostridia bacterium]|nr:helix-turn-helix transcriptional regulator [Clostridia bacterium]
MLFTEENQRVEMSAHSKLWMKGQSAFKWHKNCEIVMPLDKPCSFWTAGKIVHAKKGDIVFFNSRTVHSFIMEEEETRLGLLIFDVRTILNPSVKFTPLKCHITAEEIDEISGLREKVDTLFAYAMEEGNAKKTEDNPLMQSYIATFYLSLMRHFPANNKTPEKKQITEFYKMVDYINDHFREKINISIIAKSLYMSREKASLLFRKYSNIELSEYLDKLRISNVNKLLSDGYNVTDAALESGFQSIRTFNNTYKKVMKMSPTEYIRRKESQNS